MMVTAVRPSTFQFGDLHVKRNKMGLIWLKSEFLDM